MKQFLEIKKKSKDQFCINSNLRNQNKKESFFIVTFFKVTIKKGDLEVHFLFIFYFRLFNLNLEFFNFQEFPSNYFLSHKCSRRKSILVSVQRNCVSKSRGSYPNESIYFRPSRRIQPSHNASQIFPEIKVEISIRIHEKKTYLN